MNRSHSYMVHGLILLKVILKIIGLLVKKNILNVDLKQVRKMVNLTSEIFILFFLKSLQNMWPSFVEGILGNISLRKGYTDS